MSSTEVEDDETEMTYILKPKFWRTPKLSKLIMDIEKSFLENIVEDSSPEIRNFLLKNWKRLSQNGN